MRISLKIILQCIFGFINDARRDKVECPNAECKQLMCSNCKKPVRNYFSQHVIYCLVVQWETAHDGLNCEQFAVWKKDNDPELQAQGLAAYLNEEGIGRKFK